MIWKVIWDTIPRPQQITERCCFICAFSNGNEMPGLLFTMICKYSLLKWHSHGTVTSSVQIRVTSWWISKVCYLCSSAEVMAVAVASVIAWIVIKLDQFKRRIPHDHVQKHRQTVSTIHQKEGSKDVPSTDINRMKKHRLGIFSWVFSKFSMCVWCNSYT